MILSCFKVLLVIVIAGSCLSVEDCGEVKDHHWKRNSNMPDQHCSQTRGKVALVLGASGETGKEVVKNLVKSDNIAKVIIVGRKELVYPDEDIYRSKISQKIVDFDNLESSADVFAGVDVAFCCLGTTRAVAGAEGFVKVDHDYVLSAAKLLKQASCPDFHLLTRYLTNHSPV